MPPYSPSRTLSDSDLQNLLLSEQGHDDYLPLFQDLTPGFEFLYSAPASPTLDSDTTFCSPKLEYNQCKQVCLNAIFFFFVLTLFLHSYRKSKRG